MNEGKKEMMVHKFTLSSKKVIYLREPKIGDQEVVANLVGKEVEGNTLLMGVKFGKEMFKQLIVQIDNNRIEGATLNLDKEFTYQEYMECEKAVKMMIGEDGSKKIIPIIVPDTIEVNLETDLGIIESPVRIHAGSSFTTSVLISSEVGGTANVTAKIDIEDRFKLSGTVKVHFSD